MVYYFYSVIFCPYLDYEIERFANIFSLLFSDTETLLKLKIMDNIISALTGVPYMTPVHSEIQVLLCS